MSDEIHKLMSLLDPQESALRERFQIDELEKIVGEINWKRHTDPIHFTMSADFGFDGQTHWVCFFYFKKTEHAPARQQMIEVWGESLKSVLLGQKKNALTAWRDSRPKS